MEQTRTKKARPNPQCTRCRILNEYHKLKSQSADPGYIPVSVDVCPFAQLREAEIEQIRIEEDRCIPRSPEYDWCTPIHGVDCSVKDRIIHNADSCIYCKCAETQTIANYAAQALGEIKELGDLCASFITDTPTVPVLPRGAEPGTIDWDAVVPDKEYLIPGSVTTISSKSGFFSTFKVARICRLRPFMCRVFQFMAHTPRSSKFHGLEYSKWAIELGLRDRCQSLLDKALDEFLAQPELHDQGHDNHDDPDRDLMIADDGEHMAYVRFRWERDTSSPRIASFEYGRPWAYHDRLLQLDIETINCDSIDPLVLTRRAYEDEGRYMFLRQGNWLYIVYETTGEVGHVECNDCFRKGRYNMEEVCESKAPPLRC